MIDINRMLKDYSWPTDLSKDERELSKLINSQEMTNMDILNILESKKYTSIHVNLHLLAYIIVPEGIVEDSKFPIKYDHDHMYAQRDRKFFAIFSNLDDVVFSFVIDIIFQTLSCIYKLNYICPNRIYCLHHVLIEGYMARHFRSKERRSDLVTAKLENFFKENFKHFFRIRERRMADEYCDIFTLLTYMITEKGVCSKSTRDRGLTILKEEIRNEPYSSERFRYLNLYTKLTIQAKKLYDDLNLDECMSFVMDFAEEQKYFLFTEHNMEVLDLVSEENLRLRILKFIIYENRDFITKEGILEPLNHKEHHFFIERRSTIFSIASQEPSLLNELEAMFTRYDFSG